MLHFPMSEMDRRPNYHHHNCRGSLRNWPLVPERNMDPFMNSILDPVSEFMSRVLEPETCRALNTVPSLAPALAGNDDRNEVILTRHKFQINLDVDGFKPEELEVKTKGNTITMQGKHNEQTEHSHVSRSFSRKWEIPDGVKVDEINCHLNSKDGILQLEAPRIPPKLRRHDHTYMIPIMIENEKKPPPSPNPSTEVQYDQAELDKNAQNLAKETEKMTE